MNRSASSSLADLASVDISILSLSNAQKFCGVIHAILKHLASVTFSANAGLINDLVEDTTAVVELYKKLFMVVSSSNSVPVAASSSKRISGLFSFGSHSAAVETAANALPAIDVHSMRGQLVNQVDLLLNWTKKICQDASAGNTQAFTGTVIGLSRLTKSLFVLENACFSKPYICCVCSLSLDRDCIACDNPHSGEHAWFHRSCVGLSPGENECAFWSCPACMQSKNSSAENLATDDLDEASSFPITAAITAATAAANAVAKASSSSSSSSSVVSPASANSSRPASTIDLRSDLSTSSGSLSASSVPSSSKQSPAAAKAAKNDSGKSSKRSSKMAEDDKSIKRNSSFLRFFRRKDTKTLSTASQLTSFSNLSAVLDMESMDDDSVPPGLADDADKFETDSIASESSHASTTQSDQAGEVNRTIRALLQEVETSLAIEGQINKELADSLVMCSKAEEKQLTQKLKESDQKIEALTQQMLKYQRQLGDPNAIGKELIDKQFKAVEALLEKMQTHPLNLLGGSRMHLTSFQQARAYFFLKSCNWSLSDAYKKLEKSLIWREKFRPDSIPDEGFNEEAESGKFYAHKFDRHGNVAVIFRMRYHVVGKSDLKRTIRHWLWIIDNLIASSENPYQQIVWIYDRRNSTSKNSDVKMMKLLVHMLDEYYPERVFRIYVLNADTTFRIGYKMVQKFMRRNDRDKFCILSRKEEKWKGFLVNEFGASNLQIEFGGTDPYVYSNKAYLEKQAELRSVVATSEQLNAQPSLSQTALQKFAEQRRVSLFDNLEENFTVSRTRRDSLLRTMETDLGEIRRSFERTSTLTGVRE